MRAAITAVAALVVAWLCAMAPARAQAPATSTRLRVVLVLDASGSMASNDPRRVVATSAKIFTELVDERDHLTVLSFGSAVQKLGEGRGDAHDALRDAVGRLGKSESCTDYAQALEAASRELPGKPPAGERRVVLFLTDGRYEPSRGAGCGPFETGGGAEADAAERRVRDAASALAASSARVFTVVLGKNALGAQRSSALLREVAQRTNGRFVPAQTAQDVPQLFASILGALVGAPVVEESLSPGRTSVQLVAPKGSDRLHVVLVPDALGDVAGATLRRGGAVVPFEPPRAEGPGGYRVARFVGDATGTYTLDAPTRGRVSVLFVPDAGLSLQIEGVPAVLPEGEPLKGNVALRSRGGDAVKLSPDYLSKVVFSVSMGDRPLYDDRPNAAGIAPFATGAGMPKGSYVLRATGRHELGFLDVPPVEKKFDVAPRFALKTRAQGATFDTMAEEGSIPLSGPLAIDVESPDPLSVDVTYDVRLAGPGAEDLIVTPKTVTFGPKHPRRLELAVAFADPESLRSAARRYDLAVELVPDAGTEQVLIGEKIQRAPLQGRLRPWDWRRWLDEYGAWIATGLGVILILVWIVGRMMAAKFPVKARVRWVEIGQDFENDALIKRHARHGAFRAARFSFPLGKKAKPLVAFRAQGAGFEVLPPAGAAIEVRDDTVPETERSKRKPFRGQWEQRYRLGDRYDVWLTRS